MRAFRALQALPSTLSGYQCCREGRYSRIRAMDQERATGTLGESSSRLEQRRHVLVTGKLLDVSLERPKNLLGQRATGAVDRGQKVVLGGTVGGPLEVLPLKGALSRLACGELDVGWREELAAGHERVELEVDVGDLLNVPAPDCAPTFGI